MKESNTIKYEGAFTSEIKLIDMDKLSYFDIKGHRVDCSYEGLSLLDI